MRRGTGPALLGVAALGIVAAVGYGVLRSSDDLFAAEECTVTVDGQEVELSIEQAEHASLITAIAVRRGLPARAASIALATAYQESDLYNVEYGDRDSVGLFQQRPSQGWGSPDEILDPVYSTNAFYDALVEVEGYESMDITVAAQEVQRSAFPNAYANHEDNARAIASALAGHSPGAFTCEVSDDVDESDPSLTETGLTERAESVRQEALGVFGDLQLGGFQPGGVGDGHMEGSTHYEGRAVDVFVRPVTDANKVRGWAIAHYFVAQSQRLGVQTVIFDDRIWTARRSEQGWRDYDPPASSGDPAILEHRDHVHVDVFS
jgi:hypothetical protein